MQHSEGQKTKETAAARRVSSSAIQGPSMRPAVRGRLIYEDRTGPHQYEIVLDSTMIGRGGTMFPVNVRIATTDDVSREHARLRRAADTGDFFVIDLSTHGTTVDGRPVPRGFHEDAAGKRENGAEMPLPPRARIGLAGTVFVDFERF